PKIKTFQGELEVKSFFRNSLGFFAVTGEGLSQRTWMLTKEEYKRLIRDEIKELRWKRIQLSKIFVNKGYDKEVEEEAEIIDERINFLRKELEVLG
ncbi:MAG: hypothetical protein QXP04_00370, partial [Candidatus Nanoarchaeia archaeon]|nr:hypothetical protein [Candidatus Jingweiarchaeum tengchongense]